MKEQRDSMEFPRSVFFLFLIAVFTLSLFPHPSLARNKLVKTPSDYEGPFYPLVRQQDEDNDLIHVAGREHAAKGEILHLSGRVVDENGQKYDKAVVEIWQTDPHGRYKDQRDRSIGQRDPNFQYWGKAVTAGDGNFSFTTLIPGTYKPRPAHIHFKVWIDGKVRLTSQIYFKETSILEENETAQPVAIQELQIVDLRRKKSGDYEAFFQIVL
jgi:protocatechuate 3,4-dioxygenase beta subunit